MSASNPFHDDIRISLELVMDYCDEIKDLPIQRKAVEEKLNPLIIEAAKAGIDISFYMSYYISCIEKVMTEFKYLYVAKIYIGYATTLLQNIKDIEIRETHEDALLRLSFRLDESITSNIKVWVVAALRAINDEKFDAAEAFLKQIVDNLKFIDDSLERETNAAVLSHCYSILITQKIITAEDSVVNKKFDAAVKHREDAVGFLKYVRDEDIKTFHWGKLNALQAKIVESSAEFCFLPEKTAEIAVSENKGILENPQTSPSRLSFSSLNQFFINTFGLEDSSDDNPQGTTIPVPKIGKVHS